MKFVHLLNSPLTWFVLVGVMIFAAGFAAVLNGRPLGEESTPTSKHSYDGLEEGSYDAEF